jgi:hypothetical protein
MKGIMQREKEMPVFAEIERGLQMQPNTYERRWRSHRYIYYCGDWRYDWHEERKVEHRNSGATIIAPRI